MKIKRIIKKLKIKWKNSLIRKNLKLKMQIKHLEKQLEETKEMNHKLIDQKTLDNIKIRELSLKVVLIVGMILLPLNIQAKTYTKKECKQYTYQQVIKRGWTFKDYSNLVKLWNKESNWNYKAVNRHSGACGIPQAYPCSKMKKYGKDYKTNCKVQIKWGLVYIKSRYKTPTKAWQFFQKRHWY